MNNIVNIQQNEEKENQIINQAISILENRLQKNDLLSMSSAGLVQNFLKLELCTEECEHFCVLFLNNKHKLIKFEKMFRGTIDGASVYPREVVKEALKHNAAAVIFAHNHPSGETEPSQADMRITERLKSALELVDVRVIDHIIVSNFETTSFAQQGLMV